METDELLKMLEGIPNEEFEKETAQEYYKLISDELKKLSKRDAFGRNLKAAYSVRIIIDEEYGHESQPQYRVYVNGTNDKNLQELVDAAMKKFIEEGHYAFHYSYNQLESQIPSEVQSYLNDNTDTDEYWCRMLFKSMTLSGAPLYPLVVLCFDKSGLESSVSYNGKRHPFLDSLKIEWSFGKVNDIENKKFSYNELFRRSATRCDHFIYLYEDVFNTLSALKYENELNVGSILSIKETREKNYDKLQSNYDVSIYFEQPIEIGEDSLKKVRKLLEITNRKLSLLMNGNGEIFGIDKMVNKPSCEYYQVCFDGFMKWILYKNGEKFLRFENMLPRIPDQEIGVSEGDITLFKKTFNITDASKFEKIIGEAVTQRHGTMVVFAENAGEESERLRESGINIKPIDVSAGLLVEAASAIDGALICDSQGVCYSIGTILDGIASTRADSSRGARYNSAIRYIEQQKDKKQKTFIVVVSEDGYVNCFSTIYEK